MSRELASNSAVAIGVAFLHVVAIAMLNRARLTTPSESREFHSELIFVEAPVPNKRKAVPAPVPQLARSLLPRLPDESASTAISLPSIDWHQQGAQSAAGIARD